MLFTHSTSHISVTACEIHSASYLGNKHLLCRLCTPLKKKKDLKFKHLK